MGPEVIEVTDPDDPRLVDYLHLRDVSLRRHLEAERGLFLAEGEKVIRRALAAGCAPRSLMLAPRWLDALRPVLAEATTPDGGAVPVYVVSEELAERVTGFHVHRGALASMHRTVERRPEELLGLPRLVVGEDLVDHTNVGAILRGAAGLGWDGLLLSAHSADPLYRRAVKVAMGTVFSLPWARLAPEPGRVRWLAQAGYVTVAMALGDGARPLDEVARAVRDAPRVALLLGTEGAGLSEEWIREADHVAVIPMAAGVDSLNVAAASAVACWELRAQSVPSPPSPPSAPVPRGLTGQSAG